MLITPSSSVAIPLNSHAVTETDEAKKKSSVVMYDNSDKPVARYHLENAWPSKSHADTWDQFGAAPDLSAQTLDLSK